MEKLCFKTETLKSPNSGHNFDIKKRQSLEAKERAVKQACIRPNFSVRRKAILRHKSCKSSNREKQSHEQQSPPRTNTEETLHHSLKGPIKQVSKSDLRASPTSSARDTSQKHKVKRKAKSALYTCHRRSALATQQSLRACSTDTGAPNDRPQSAKGKLRE